MTRRGSLVANAALVVAGLVVGLLLAEAAYRVKLEVQHHAFDTFFDVTGITYPPRHANYAMSFPPNFTYTRFNVRNGVVTWCPEVLFRSNADGATGATTVAQYDAAELKVLVFGDSFSAWNRAGRTWPDIFERLLRQRTGKDVRVLNYARPGIGLLQMFDLAAARVAKLHPDLVIFAFITDDLTRARWWLKTVSIDGEKRILLSPKQGVFDPGVAADVVLYDPGATLAWCRRNLGSRRPDPVLERIDDRYRRIREQFYRLRGMPLNLPFTLRQSYLWNRLRYGRPFLLGSGLSLPRIAFDDYTRDTRFPDEVAGLAAGGARYEIVHIPDRTALESGTVRLDTRQSALLASLEALTGHRTVYLHRYLGDSPLPEKITLAPHDDHPNLAGLRLYAELMTRFVADRIRSLPEPRDGGSTQ